MGQCDGKTVPTTIIVSAGEDDQPPQTPITSSANNGTVNVPSVKNTPSRSSMAASQWSSLYPYGRGSSPLPGGVTPSPARSTPRRFFKRPFPPPSPAKYIKASLARRFGHNKPREGPIPEDGATETDQSLDLNSSKSINL